MYEKLSRNDSCWCGSGKKYKKCHYELDERIAQYARTGHLVPTRDLIKTPEQIEGIRKSGVVNVAVLDYVAANIKEGMTTEEIDRLVSEKTAELGGIPAPLGFEGYPKSVCTSINEQVCHGIPAATDILKSGDIVNVDVSTILDGYYSDSSRMFLIGEVSEENRKLVEVTKASIEEGLKYIKPWAFLGDMGFAINAFAQAHGYSVVEEIGGHGVGLEFHEDPWVSHVANKGEEMLIVPGMVFTIEPMINMGKRHVFEDADNGWTVYTKDGLPSAQWEVTVAITEDGYEILAW